MKTVKEFLVSTFGDSANEIEGIDNFCIGGFEFGDVRFAFCGDNGRLHVSCGGTCLICFYAPSRSNVRGAIYLVYDDSDGRKWDVQAERGIPLSERTQWHRPFERLRLAYAV